MKQDLEQNADPRHWSWDAGLAILAISALAFVLSVTGADPDLWGHLRFGLDILDSGSVAQSDPYSYITAGQRWINHEWLAETLFGIAWKAGGATGLIALKMGIGFLTVGALVWQLLAFRLHAVQATIILLVLLGAPVFLPFFTVRPQIFTCLLFALLLIAIRRGEDGHYGWLWIAPPIMTAWANLHGGFLAGLGMLGLWAALHLPFHYRDRWRFLPAVFVATVATTLNPYGMDLLFFLLHTATGSRPEIQDWQPLILASGLGMMYVVVLTVTAGGIALSQERRKPVLLALCAMTALLPWMAMRHLVLFSITAIVFAGEHIGSAWQSRISDKGKQAELPTLPWAGALPLVAAAALIGLGVSNSSFTRIRIPSTDDWPSKAVALLAQSGLSGNVMTEYGWGEYVIWHLGPRIQVGMDGRRETIYPPGTYTRYLDLIYGIHDWDALLRQHQTDAVLIPTGQPIHNLLKLSPGWLLVFQDSKSALFVRKTSTFLEPLRHAAKTFVPPPPSEYFP